uniref:DUF1677 family protein n=1 Tax=Oryza punctata TaxID=4537 RepID=A0A0E0JIL4_ORYPU
MKGLYTAHLADKELDLEIPTESEAVAGADEELQQEEAWSVRCECCGMAEDCTPGYVRRVRARFEGRLVCGLCAEAVSERRRREPALTVGEAVQSHASLCDRFNSTVRLNPTLSLARSMRDIARTNCLSRHRSARVETCGVGDASSKIGRVETCTVPYAIPTRDGEASLLVATRRHQRPSKAACDREEVLDLAGDQTAAARQGDAWYEEALNLAGGHTATTEVAWQGRRVMWDRVEALDLTSGGGG